MGNRLYKKSFIQLNIKLRVFPQDFHYIFLFVSTQIMKATIIRNKLNNILKSLERICRKNINLPILETVLIEGKDSRLFFSATNLEEGIVWKTLASIEKEGKICAPIKLFSNIISGLSENQVLIETKDNFLKILTPSTNIKIKTLNPEEFPIIPLYKEEVSIVISSEMLNYALSKVVGIPSPLISTPEFTGVLLRFEDDNIFFVSTDRFRLAEERIKYKKIFEKRVDLIIPQESVKNIINIFQNEGEIELFLNPNQIWLKKEDQKNFEETIFTSKLISGEYPEYKEILPKEEEYKTRVVVDKNRLLTSLRLGADFYGKLNQVNLRFLPKENKILIFGQDPNVGEYKSEISTKIEGKEMEVILNYKFLLEGINLVEGKEININLIDDEKPLLIKGEEENFIYIVMPIKPA